MRHKFEVEQKYRVNNPLALRRAILKAGARAVGRGIESNELYDFKKSLRKRRSILRLRLSHFGGLLTFKGPCLKSAFKKRVEMETAVDYNAARAILKLAGFRVVAKYKKKREEFRLGSAHITLDYLSGFGWFAEIEAAPGQILRVQKKIGLASKDREDRSYLQMIYGKNWR